MRFATMLSSAVLLGVLSPSFAASKAQAPSTRGEKLPSIPYEKYKLQNGLEVILSEDHRLPLVSVDLWYHVGPVKERAGRTGFAHLFEHMMFEGSKHVGEKVHFKYLEAAGASDINGTTDFDRTNYFETLPSNQLELALWLESDRMGFLLDTLDAAKLANQRDVVRNERRQSVENRPYGLVEEAVYHNLYPKTHPYYAAVIGSHADIEAARLNDIRDFFKQYYAPNNATIVIAGDFQKPQAKAMVEKYFGPLSPTEAVAPTSVETPAITSERRQTVTDTIQLPRIYIAWLTPKAFQPGDAEADLASRILGGGKSSRLYRKLVYEQQIAQDVNCEHQSLALGSPLICRVTARPNVKVEDLEKAAEKEIDEFTASGPSQAELDRARNKQETGMINGLQVLGGFGGVADTLNYYNQYLGDPGYLPKDLARYDQATIASVKEFAKGNLAANQRVVVIGVPGQKSVDDVARAAADADANVKITPEYSEQFETAQAWRAKAPQPGPQPKLNLPVPKEFALKNGLKVLVTEQHELPLINARLVTLGGGEGDDVAKPGVAGFTAAMLTEGTTKRSAPQIADDTDQMGATLTKGSSPDIAFINAHALRKNAEPLLGLVAELATQPAFDAKEIERVRKQRQTALLQLQDQPQQLGILVGARALYGPKSPYGYTGFGTKESLGTIQRDDLVHFWQSHYGPADSALILAGDINVEQARTMAEKYFDDWKGAATASHPPAAPQLPTRKIIVVDKPGAPQSSLLAFAVGLPRSTPDYPAVTVMNTMLGGLFSSRINMNLREQHGYTYGAFSFYQFQRGPGPFIAGAEVRTDVTAPAAKELFSELEKIDATPLNAEELKISKDFVIRSLPGDFETNEGTSARIAQLWTYNLPNNYYQNLPTMIDAVTSQQAAQAASKYVKPQNTLLVVVGDRSKVAAGLEELKLGPVEVWDADAQPVKEKAGSGGR